MTVIEPVPVMRNVYLTRFMEVAPRCCESPEACLEQANLPASPPDNPDAYVPLKPALAFMSWALRGADIGDLLLRNGVRLRISDFNPELAARIRSAPTLHSALHGFFSLANRELSSATYWLTRDGGELCIHSTLHGVGACESQYCGEWLRIMSLLTLVRRFAGNAWTPARIGLQARREPGRAIRGAFPNTRFYTGQVATRVAFPAALLRTAPANCRPEPARTRVIGRVPAHSDPAAWDFPASIREILKTYMNEGCPDIGFAARIVGCSVRTLQRRLSQCRVRYSDVVGEARFELAAQLLREGDGKIIDAAYSVGYSDPSHFARAFRRLAGVSPSQYRRLGQVATAA